MGTIKVSDPIDGGLEIGVYKSVVVITTVRMRALNTTARAIVPAPGAGLAIVPLDMSVKMTGATAFGGIANTENIIVRYDGTTTTRATIEPTGFLDQTDRPTRVVSFASATAYEPIANQALEVSNSGAITGGSPVEFTTYYRVISV